MYIYIKRVFNAQVLEYMTNICLKEKRVSSNLITITNVISFDFSVLYRYKDIVILINIPLKVISLQMLKLDDFEKHTWKQI